jgi:putative Holliday junction resolvase
MRILGLDVGSKTIGVAVSDELGITAQGVTTLTRKELSDDSAQLLKVVEEYKAERIVVGLPKNMNGTLGPAAQMVLSLIEELQKAVTLPIVTWDERLSTMAAERTLLEADVSRKKRKQVIDKVAAILILQGYLDSLARVKDIS